MASVISLGIHKSLALPFLIAEGILPSDASEDLLAWQTVGGNAAEDFGEEEELANTDYCVIWSRGSVIQRVYRFEAEKESVTEATFTRFPSEVTTKPICEAIKDGTPQHKQPGSVVTPIGLNIRKVRASTSESEVIAPKQDSSQVKGENRCSLNEEGRNDDRTLGRRALVVILKTHAHVFFISGTSHTVHLPFEVERVFPLCQGILLQRKLSKPGGESSVSKLPSVPPNSFAFAVPTSAESSHEQTAPAHLSVAPSSDLLSLPLPSDLLRESRKSTEAGLPRLFCLTDPLTEMGIVVTGYGSTTSKSLEHRQSITSLSDALDQNEDLLYVSAEDEFGHHRLGLKMQPTVLAVTRNHKTGMITIWSIAYVDAKTITDPPRHMSSMTSGSISRRRSSYGVGAGTGATTPVTRGAVGGRESLGVAGSRPQSFKDSTLDEASENAEEDLVSQLDPAFGNPSVPAKASRRVSSLLARADLSTSRDRSTFSELATGYAAPNGNRRGASFGAYGVRVSSGLDGVTGQSYSKSFSGERSSLDPPSLSESSFEEDIDGSDIMPKLTNLDLGDAARGLREEMVLTKIYSVPIEKSNGQRSSSRSTQSARLKVFTIRPSYHDLGNDCEDAIVIMCLLDHNTCELSVMEINLQQHPPLERTSDNKLTGSKGLQASTVNITRHANVIDACKIKNKEYCRILLISKGADGLDEMSLQAPWSPMFKFKLPSSLYINNPYCLTNSEFSRQRRVGGFKRVLSEGPQAFVALDHADNNGRVDVVDNEGRRHRVEIQLGPHNPYILKMMQVSEAILPRSEKNRETLLRGWWDVMSWLRSRPDEVQDMEWTAMIVLLFSMAGDFPEAMRPETVTRQRKRKGGLLRSSSGANTDLESWETMLNEECLFSPSPPWMQDVAWRWTVNQETNQATLPSTTSKPSRSSRSLTKSVTSVVPIQKNSSRLLECVSLARDFSRTPLGIEANGQSGYLPTALSSHLDLRRTALATILVGLHLLREEYKLDVLVASALHDLAPVLAQIGGWLGWESWGYHNTSYFMLESADMKSWLFDHSVIRNLKIPREPFAPPSIFLFIENSHLAANIGPFMSLLDVVGSPDHGSKTRIARGAPAQNLLNLTPRSIAINSLLMLYPQVAAETRVADMASWGIEASALETLPESVAVAFRAAICSCQSQPVTTWGREILNLIGRDDIGKLEQDTRAAKPFMKAVSSASNRATRDVHLICNTTLEIETVGAYDGSAEEDRESITNMIFKDDQRFAEAAKLVHPIHAPLARCIPEPDWSDTELLEAQQEMVKIIAMRTLSTSLGRGLMFYCARLPLLTEKFPIHGFTLSCVMRPTNTTVTADRNVYTEEKVSWAFFHAGVEAGLSISRNAKGVDTSWILFNKPQELKNRHAGFLLGLGLNGHLKAIAKWVAFKYLTPKHTMTSIGLLLGLSASYIGTMDTLITRLLSVHVTRMLPPGAAELGLSPLTQTSGIMGIGLLYCNTQHRRMSEIMLSEMENIDFGDNSSPLDSLRDEGYRLAAGFALGYINLGRGKDLKGLHDMQIVQRLLALAVGTRKVDIVHILDKTTAAATIAVALIFMKTEDAALARKIDIPDTVHQFDYVRPDIFLLRTVARHLIMWDEIRATTSWIKQQLPAVHRAKLRLTLIRMLNSEDMPFFNVLAGLCLSIGLRYAGSGSFEVRNLLCHYLDQFMRVCALPTLNYDGKLARITVRNCQDVVALAAACVMAGTGDLLIFRRLRSLHGRVDADTPYGSHLAAHMAIGVLFLGGGTHTFGTSNIATASLLCAFYPLFPNTVLDNKSHLQAFRHFWVLAAEPRCFVARDADSHRPISLTILVTLRTGEEVSLTAPCLLPELETVVKIQTNDSEYWGVTLDLSGNPAHLRAFKRHQSIYVRRRAAYDAHTSIFSATIKALNESQLVRRIDEEAFQWVFKLPSFANYDRAEQALVLPDDAAIKIYSTLRGTVVDDRLVLETGCMESGSSERLWNLRILFAWADGLSRRGEKWSWYGKEVVESLRAALRMRIKVGNKMTIKSV